MAKTLNCSQKDITVSDQIQAKVAGIQLWDLKVLMSSNETIYVMFLLDGLILISKIVGLRLELISCVVVTGISNTAKLCSGISDGQILVSICTNNQDSVSLSTYVLLERAHLLTLQSTMEIA